MRMPTLGRGPVVIDPEAADARGMVYVIGGYAVVFGVFVALGALVVSRAHATR